MLPFGVGGSLVRGSLLFPASDPLVVFSTAGGGMLSAEVTFPFLVSRAVFATSFGKELALVFTFLGAIVGCSSKGARWASNVGARNSGLKHSRT
jgi:hypothetical protein